MKLDVVQSLSEAGVFGAYSLLSVRVGMFAGALLLVVASAFVRADGVIGGNYVAGMTVGEFGEGWVDAAAPFVLG